MGENINKRKRHPEDIEICFCTTKLHILGVLHEDKIAILILPHLSKGKRGFSSKVDLTKVVSLIFKRLKTGCQWRELSIKEYFFNNEIIWEGVYYYHNKWSKDDS